MAYEVIEDNHDKEEIVVIGVQPNGYKVAEKLISAIQKISDIRVTLHALSLDKNEPVHHNIEYDFSPEALHNKVCLLVDDVANTGRTLFYACHPFMQCSPHKLRIAVLVERSHKRFPISSDYIGLPLSTTMKEHVVVRMEDEEAVYLEE